MAKTISKRKGVCGGTACISGRRIPVWIVVCHFAGGASMRTIAGFFEDVTVRQVEDCIRYAMNHPEEINRAIAENQ